MKSINGKKGFRVISRRSAFRGRLVHLDVLNIQSAGGRLCQRELIKHPGAVVIIPRLDDGRLVLVKQLRVATGKEILEFPAGTLEKGETTFNCARRELQEETGWKPGRLRKILDFFPTPGISTEKMYLFIADRLKKAPATTCDPDEELEVGFFKISELDRMIRRGKIIDGKTVLGFLYFQHYHNSKRRRPR